MLVVGFYIVLSIKFLLSAFCVLGERIVSEGFLRSQLK